MGQFVEMLAEVRATHDTSKALAVQLGVSPQYLHDIERGRRLPSVAFVDRLCLYLGRGPVGRLEWHRAAAEAHGWKLSEDVSGAGRAA